MALFEEKSLTSRSCKKVTNKARNSSRHSQKQQVLADPKNPNQPFQKITSLPRKHACKKGFLNRFHLSNFDREGFLKSFQSK